MPKKSTKSKSKRMSLKQKYKIIKKVKEHHKKKKKELKKQGGKVKGPKDPGLPAQWPFKDELIKEFAWKRAQILADEKRKKEERKARRMGLADGADGEMAALQASATAKEVDFETRKRARIADDFQTDKDGSRKAFYKEFRRVVEMSDVVIQVLDARDPLACRCPDVERYIRSTSPNKKIILLLNKMDLVPREAGERWLKYFREELPTVAFKCSTQHQGTGLKQGKMPSAKSLNEGLTGAGCLGADTLLAMLKNYTRNAGIKTSITVGVVGLPNVGKSSLINSLKRARVAQVGNTPGVTKSVQEVHLDKNIKLLDSPGVVFADAESEAAGALRNAVKIERLQDPLGPISEILKRVPAKQLMTLYKVPAFKTADDFLAAVAGARGKLRKGGTPDMRASARIVLQDWNDGRIPYYTTPPTRGNTEFDAAEVVGGWSKEFDAEAVFAAERSAVIAHLPSSEDRGAVFFEATSAGAAKVDTSALMEEDNEEEEGSDDVEGSDDAMDASDDDDVPSGQDMDDDDEYGAPAAKKRAGVLASAAGQEAVLYTEAGQFNPHKARASKKAAKKAARGQPKQAAQKKKKGDDSGSDYEFEEEGSGDMSD